MVQANRHSLHAIQAFASIVVPEQENLLERMPKQVARMGRNATPPTIDVADSVKSPFDDCIGVFQAMELATQSVERCFHS